MRDPQSKYCSHANILSLVACGFCYHLGWTSESTQMKLGLAVLIHDITLDESYYSDINYWNLVSSSKSENGPQVQRYSNHPIDAAHLLLGMKNIQPDVDQIIVQHHENQDGNGFPKKLISTRITPLACILIMTEDLIHFINEAHEVDDRIQMFLKLREQVYSRGNFRKVFEALRDSFEKTKSGP
jgi:hypothetical protein